MRRSLIALWLIALMSNAVAADYELPDLRGITPYVPAPPVFTRWSGYYVGGQAGYGNSRTNFTGAGGFANIFNPQNCLVNPWSVANPDICLIRPVGPVSNWAKFGTDGAAAAAYGAFVGYNSQWDDVVLGLDINYNHTSLSGASTFSKVFPGIVPGDVTGNTNNIYDAWAGAAAVMKIKDYATFRIRAGWAFDTFLPFATFGVAVGRADIVRFANATLVPAANSPGTTTFVINDGNQQTAVTWGYTAGLGIDMALGAKMFARAEYEFVQFVPTSHITANINTVRVGAGYRF